jgi:2-methylcitrate dehydratase PrpD
MDTANISDLIAAHVAQIEYEQLSPAAADAAKRSLLDAIGVMLGASGLGEGCAAFVDLALGSGGPAECTILGQGAKAPLLPAVLANGALAHALDFEDAFDAAPCHPNAALIPVALGLAEAHGPISGRTFLTALAVGCDLVCRLSLALRNDPADFGWYTPPILGAFGAAAGAARLLRLSPLATRDALSLTLCQSTCSAELKYSSRSVVRAVRDGFAAHAGLLSALLAQRNVAGFEQPIEGRAGLYALYARGQWSPQTLIDQLGKNFHGAQVSFKCWPSCRGTHALVEGALELRKHLWSVEEIDGIRTRGGPVQRMLTEPRAQKLNPQTAIDAKFSIPFTVATALVHGEVTLARFSPESLLDQRVLSLAQRVTFELDSSQDSADGGEIQITLRNGRTFRSKIDHPRGHCSRPLDWAELIEKFRRCAVHAARAQTDVGLEKLIAAVRHLEESDDVALALFPAAGAGL